MNLKNIIYKILAAIFIAVVFFIGGFLVGAKYYNHINLVIPVAQKNKIKIGAIFDLTGSLSYMGKWSQQGAELAVEEINSSGGINGNKVELFIEDGTSNANTSVSAFEKLINVDKLSVVIGFNASSEVSACAPIANKNKIIIFSTGAASPTITQAGDYIFRNRLSGQIEVIEMAKIAYDDMKITDLAIVYINNDYGVGFKTIFEEEFEKLGGIIITEQAFDQNQTDYKSIITNLKSKENIKTIYLIPYAKEGANLLKQSKEVGFNPLWLSANAIESQLLFDIAGNSANGLIYTVAKYDPTDDQSLTFNKKYKDKYGDDSEMFAANAYDGVFILAGAIEKFGDNTDKIKNYLYALKNYKGVAGMTSFDVNGDVDKPVMIKIVKDGKFLPYEIN